MIRPFIKPFLRPAVRPVTGESAGATGPVRTTAPALSLDHSTHVSQLFLKTPNEM